MTQKLVYDEVIERPSSKYRNALWNIMLLHKKRSIYQNVSEYEIEVKQLESILTKEIIKKHEGIGLKTYRQIISFLEERGCTLLRK